MTFIVWFCLWTLQLTQAQPDAEIISFPMSVRVGVNSTVNVSCTARGLFIFFEVNHMSIDLSLRNLGFNDEMATVPSVSDPNVRTRTLIVTGTPQNNGSNITCVAISSSSVKISNPALLVVAGKADMISSFNITTINSTTVRISWSPPFTPKGVPILGYYVTITNIVGGEQETFFTNKTYLQYTFSHSNSFTVTVTASNIAGLGELFVSQEHKSPLPSISTTPTIVPTPSDSSSKTPNDTNGLPPSVNTTTSNGGSTSAGGIAGGIIVAVILFLVLVIPLIVSAVVWPQKWKKCFRVCASNRSALDLENALLSDELLKELKGVDVYQLGRSLGVSDVTLFKLKGNSDQKKKAMFVKWLDANPLGSWNDVFTALDKIDEHSLAISIENKYCGPSTQLIPKQRRTDLDSGSTDHFAVYIGELKRIYQTLTPTWDPLPEYAFIKPMIIEKKGKVYGVGKVLIHQYMMGDVETIETSEMPVEVDKLFDSGTFNEDHRLILITGAPGTGKTSLAFYFCREWALDNLSMFDVVAFIQLRDLTGTEATITLSDLLLLARRSADQKKEVISEEMVSKLTSPSIKLLLVLDGWDEAPSNIRKRSFVTRILQPMSSGSRILITSRPDWLVDLYDVANHVEIVGFTEENIHEYFLRALSTEQDQDKVYMKLYECFHKYPTVQSCCSIPLNAAITARVFLTSGTLPPTRHELLLMLILDYGNKYSRREYTSLEDLPQLNQLSMLAFEGFKQSQVIFTQESLTQLALPCDLPDYGLLQNIGSLNSVEGKTMAYQFIHLTIQEFLAAYWISQLEEDEQVRVFQDLLFEHQFSTVLQSYVAFNRFSNQRVRNVITGEELTKKKMAILTIIRCFSEAHIHDEQLYQQIVSNLCGDLDLSDVNMTSLDCMSVALWGGVAIGLNISHNKIRDNDITHIAAALQENTMKTFLLVSCGISDVGAELLAKFLSTNTSLRKLDISCNNIGDNGISHIAAALHLNTVIEELPVVSCGISAVGAELLARSLSTNTSLRKLDISHNNIGDNGITHIAAALQKTMKIFIFVSCGISDVGAESLAKFLSITTSLRKLDISHNDIGDNGITHIAAALQKNTMKTFSLVSCGISDVGAESLAKFLSTNTSLRKLDISRNNIGDNGISYIAAALQSNTTVEELPVVSCGISAVGAALLARSLSTNTSLRKLDISHNNIGDNGITHIAAALQSITTVVEFHVVSCGISDVGAECIAQMLATCSSLRVLTTCDNVIGSNGIAYIATALQTCKTLQLLDIGGQTVTESAIPSIASLLARGKSLNCISLTCSLSHPEITLKKLAECVCDSSVHFLNLCMYMVQPSGTAPVSAEVEEEWLQHVVVGGKNLLCLLVTSQYLESLSLHLCTSTSSIRDKDMLALALFSTAESVNSSRNEKGLSDIKFTIRY